METSSNLFDDLKALESPTVVRAVRRRKPRQPKPAPIPPAPVPWVVRAWRGLTANPLRLLALAVACGASAVSVYYSFAWFSSTEPGWLAMVQALTITGATTLFPDLALGLWAKKRRAVAAGVVAVGLLASGFSMTNTLGRVYNARTEARQESQEAALIRQAEGEISRLDREAEALTARMAVIPPEYTTQLREVQARLTALQGLRGGVLAEVARLRTLAGPVTERADFYAFVGSATGWPADQVELAFSAVGACFWDIVAPVAAVVVFLL